MRPAARRPESEARPAQSPGGVRRSLLVSLLAAATLAFGLVGIAPRGASQTSAVPDFQLTDVNPNSPRYQKTVSPRDYRLQISAYYFGAAG